VDSADAFDAGYDAETKRMAAVLRILFHDSERSTSLLSQLNRKSIIRFLDTVFEYDPGSPNPYCGLLQIAMGPPKTKFIAPLDDHIGPAQYLGFDEWWTRRDFALRAPGFRLAPE
jgi:hypothetical protein